LHECTATSSQERAAQLEFELVTLNAECKRAKEEAAEEAKGPPALG
jgi:hypothetical protein